jgi:hypothetical protein
MAPIPLETSLVSYDPGEWPGWAYWREGKLVSCGKGKGLVGAQWCACELPRIYPMGKSKARPNDLIKLAVGAGRLTASWPEEQLIWLPPHEWKGQVPDHILYDRIREALSLEELDRLNEGLSPYAKGKHHNILDAVGIGLYALKRRRTGMT